jgi:hypothetical protein
VWLARTTDWLKLLHLPDVGWLGFLTTAACLVILIWATVRLVAKVNEDVDPAESDREMLQAINELHREGDLTEDEFRSIKSQLVTRLSTSFQETQKSRKSERSGSKLSADSSNENTVALKPEPNTQNHQSSELNEPESFASPTNVPRPSQDTNDLSPGKTAPESENNGGKLDLKSD